MQLIEKQLIEKVTFTGAQFVEGEGGAKIVKNVVMLGPVSAHGYDYSQEAMQGAVAAGLYEGVRIFINHADVREGRNLMHLAGVFRKPRHEDGKVRGDAHLLPDEYGEKFWNIAKTMPEAAGCSHIAECKLRKGEDGRDIVEQIVRVHSVDLVVQGATTKNVFEGDAPQTASVPRPANTEKQYEFIARCIGEVRAANGTITNDQASAMCFTAWSSRYEASGAAGTMTVPIPPAQELRAEENQDVNDHEIRKESTMEDLSSRIAKKMDEIDTAFDLACKAVDPRYQGAIREEVRAERDREYLERREQKKHDAKLVEEIAGRHTGRENNADVFERLDEQRRARRETARRAEEIASAVTPADLIE